MNLYLYHVQDPEYPMWVVATGWDDAVSRWKAKITEGDGGDYDGPEWVQLICDSEDLLLYPGPATQATQSDASAAIAVDTPEGGGQRPDNLYDGAVLLLRSWAACMGNRPSDWQQIAANLLTDTQALLRDEAAREESSFAAPESSQSVSPKCPGCGHDQRWLRNGVCEYFPVPVTRLNSICGHHCVFPESVSPSVDAAAAAREIAFTVKLHHFGYAQIEAANQRLGIESEPRGVEALEQIASVVRKHCSVTTVSPSQPAWDSDPQPCWSCGGGAEARDDIHVRCVDSKNVNCEVMDHWFTRKTWNTRTLPVAHAQH